jgi:predicted ribosome quality control (RQC) complex YloA/Tae2 family protein
MIIFLLFIIVFIITSIFVYLACLEDKFTRKLNQSDKINNACYEQVRLSLERIESRQCQLLNQQRQMANTIDKIENTLEHQERRLEQLESVIR